MREEGERNELILQINLFLDYKLIPLDQLLPEYVRLTSWELLVGLCLASQAIVCLEQWAQTNDRRQEHLFCLIDQSVTLFVACYPSSPPRPNLFSIRAYLFHQCKPTGTCPLLPPT